MTTTAVKNQIQSADSLYTVREQAMLLSNNSLWSGGLRNQQDAFVEGFMDAYAAGEEDNYYTYRNLHMATEGELADEAYQIGKARASYFLRNINNDWATQPMSHYGDNDTPFEKYRPVHNPFTRGQKVKLPAGTRFKTTSKEGSGITNRAITITVHFSHEGYTDGSVGKRFFSPASISYAGSGGYWREVAITPEILDYNNLPVYETEVNGVTPMKSHRFLEKD